MVDHKDILSLVAHFLKEHGYSQTLQQLELEYGKPVQPKLLNSESLSQILDDRLQYASINNRNENDIDVNEELPLRFKELVHERFINWTLPYPHKPTKLKVHSLIIFSVYNKGAIYFSTNDSQIIICKGGSITLVRMQEIIKKVLIVGLNFVLLGMSGKLYLTDEKFNEIEVIDTLSRFIIDANHVHSNGVDYIVILTWNSMLKLVKLNESSVVAALKLDQQGTCFDITTYRGEIVIVLGKLENTLLDVITIQEEQFASKYKISINDAEFTTSSFSPRFITISQKGGIPLVAVATSHEPYMRVIITSLIDFETSPLPPIARHQIIKNLNTLSPQDKFSQPLIAWRHNSEKESGIWVMGDDGVVRGLDLLDDKVAVELKQHQTKIKDFTCFYENGYEVLITSGIDRQTFEWK